MWGASNEFYGKTLMSAQLGAGGDGVVHHDEVELLLSVLGVDRGDQHAAALLAHHLPGGQIDNGHQALADELLISGLVSADKVRCADVYKRQANLQHKNPG